MATVNIHVHLNGQEIGTLCHNIYSKSLRNVRNGGVIFTITKDMTVDEMLHHIKTFYSVELQYDYLDICLVVKGGHTYHVGDLDSLTDIVAYDINTCVGHFYFMYYAVVVNVSHEATPEHVFARVLLPINANFLMMKNIILAITGHNLNNYRVFGENELMDDAAPFDFMFSKEYYFTCRPLAGSNDLVVNPFTEFLVEEQ